MKKLLLSFVVMTISWGVGFSQVSPPSSDTVSVVYFVRMQHEGPWSNFHLYDSTNYIGKLGEKEYLRYECMPGKHLFWSRSYRSDFITADLLPGKQYLVQAIPFVEGNMARVDLAPVYPNNYFLTDTILGFINSKPAREFSLDELQKEGTKQRLKTKKELAKYKENREKGIIYGELKKEWFFQYIGQGPQGF